MKEAIGVGQFLEGSTEYDTTVQDAHRLQIGSPNASALQPVLHVGKVIGDRAIAWPRDLDIAHRASQSALAECPGRAAPGSAEFRRS
jgi:hypothetical protein